MPKADADIYSPNHIPKEAQDEPGKGPRLYSSLLIALSYVLDAQDDPELHHGWRVTAVATAMAQKLMPKQITDVFFAALLHDIGGMGQFSHIVHYPIHHFQGASPEIISHPHLGAFIVKGIPGLESAYEFIADHHEWWDGSGYPSQKAEDEIALGAQLIRITDSVDIAKGFRPGSSPEQAMELAGLLTNVEVGSEVSEAFQSVISQKGFFTKLLDGRKLLSLIHKLESELDLPSFQPYMDVTGAVVSVMARVVDSKHGYMSGHSERVANYSLELARAMDLPHSEIANVRFAALLHDLGKVVVPGSIIDKPGPLSPTEAFQVKHYPMLTMTILRDIAYLPELAEITGHHHERWDGTGYPDGLKGEEIPLLARVLNVADALDAITSLRSYRPARSVAEALQVLQEGSGTQFAPRVVEAARAVWGYTG